MLNLKENKKVFNLITIMSVIVMLFSFISLNNVNAITIESNPNTQQNSVQDFMNDVNVKDSDKDTVDSLMGVINNITPDANDINQSSAKLAFIYRIVAPIASMLIVVIFSYFVLSIIIDIIFLLAPGLRMKSDGSEAFFGRHASDEAKQSLVEAGGTQGPQQGGAMGGARPGMGGAPMGGRPGMGMPMGGIPGMGGPQGGNAQVKTGHVMSIYIKKKSKTIALAIFILVLFVLSTVFYDSALKVSYIFISILEKIVNMFTGNFF